MNFIQRLCTLALVIFSCTLQINAMTRKVTYKDVQTVAGSIQNGIKLSNHQIAIIEALKQAEANIISDNDFRLLTTKKQIPNGQSGARSTKSGETRDRNKVAKNFTNFLSNFSKNIKNVPLIAIEETLEQHATGPLTNIVETVATNIAQAPAYLFEKLIKDASTQAQELFNNTLHPDDIDRALKAALGGGILPIVTLLVNNGAAINDDLLAHLEEAEQAVQPVGHLWFTTGADFIGCREVLERALTA